MPVPPGEGGDAPHLLYCGEKGIQAEFRHVGSLAEAKALPSVFNNFAVFWNGQLITVNQIDPKTLEKVIGRSGG